MGSGKGKKLAIVAVGLVGVAGLLKGFVLAPPAPVGAAAGPTTTTTVPLGPVVTLDAVTINIAEGRFLKVGLALQIAHGHERAGEGPDSDDPTKGYARALDLAISVLSGRTYEELVTAEGREAVKETLVHDLEAAYPQEVEGVYFHQFVMQ